MARPVPLAVTRDGIYPSAGGALNALRCGETSARLLLEACLDAIDADNDKVNAVVHVDRHGARAAADACDAAIKRGDHVSSLHGLPVTIKESFDVQGMPTTWGDPARAGIVTKSDSTVARRLRAAGAVLIGKTNIPEYLGDWETDNRLFGGTRNPYDLDRSAGGSSGGSAAAVASGFSYADIGSDRGGSIRLPAHYCGVHGLKPSWGLIPMLGHSVSGDRREPDIGVAGPITRTAGDLTLLLTALTGPMEPGRTWPLPAPRFSSLNGIRLAVMLDHPACPIDNVYRAVLDRFVGHLSDQGISIDMSARPDIDLDRATEVMNFLVRAETSTELDDDAYQQRAKIAYDADPTVCDFRRLNAHGSVLPHRDWLRLHEERLGFCDVWRTFFEMYDFLLCPASASTPPPFRRVDDVTTRTIPVNGSEMPVLAQHFWYGLASLCYLPAQAAPLALLDRGLPVGIQVIGPRFGDLDVIALSGLLSQAGTSLA